MDGIISRITDWGNAAYGDPRFDLSLAIRPKLNAFQALVHFSNLF